jgi:D-threo-aldose 1-dehydrogenase
LIHEVRLISGPFPSAFADGLRVGLGGAAIGNLFAPVSDQDARRLLDTAWSDGCRSFDTAPHYGHGLSERRVGDALRPHPRGDWCLSSKVGRLLKPVAHVPREQFGYVDGLPFVQQWDFSRAGIRRSIEDSLQRLGLARLDIAYLHDIDVGTHGERAAEILRQVLDEALPALRSLQEEGLIGQIGLGVNDHQVVLQIIAQASIDVVLLAGRYTLLDQAALPQLLPECQRRGIRLVLGGLYNSGLLALGARAGSGTFNYRPADRCWLERTARIESICEAHQVPLRAAALQFVQAHPAADLLLLGSRDVDEWRDALAMLRRPIPPEFWLALRRAGLLPEEAPTP